MMRDMVAKEVHNYMAAVHSSSCFPSFHAFATHHEHATSLASRATTFSNQPEFLGAMATTAPRKAVWVSRLPTCPSCPSFSPLPPQFQLLASSSEAWTLVFACLILFRCLLNSNSLSYQKLRIPVFTCLTFRRLLSSNFSHIRSLNPSVCPPPPPPPPPPSSFAASSIPTLGHIRSLNPSFCPPQNSTDSLCSPLPQNPNACLLFFFFSVLSLLLWRVECSYLYHPQHFNNATSHGRQIGLVFMLSFEIPTAHQHHVCESGFFFFGWGSSISFLNLSWNPLLFFQSSTCFFVPIVYCSSLSSFSSCFSYLLIRRNKNWLGGL
jgi:hypothetical protein